MCLLNKVFINNKLYIFYSFVHVLYNKYFSILFKTLQ